MNRHADIEFIAKTAIDRGIKNNDDELIVFGLDQHLSLCLEENDESEKKSMSDPVGTLLYSFAVILIFYANYLIFKTLGV